MQWKPGSANGTASMPMAASGLGKSDGKLWARLRAAKAS